MKKIVTALILSCAFACGVARAQLIDVGNGLINHPAANMTWTADTNLFLTQVTADPGIIAAIMSNWHNPLPFDYVLTTAEFNTANGTMTWVAATAWADWLNRTNYKGYVDWRLADVGPAGLSRGCGGCYPSSGYPIVSSEWFQLFYTELGGQERQSILTTHNASLALFTNLQDASFWAGNGGGELYNMYSTDGGQSRNLVPTFARAWAVRTGQSVVSPPPVPHLVLTTPSLEFAGRVAGTTSAAQSVTITNTGTAPSALAISASGDFSVVHNCPASLTPGANCVANVTFTPSTVDARSGTLAIDAAQTRSVALSGVGLVGVTFTVSANTAVATVPITLTWTATPAGAQCDAGTSGSNGWNGSVAWSGSMVVTESAPGETTYSLFCSLGSQGESGTHNVTYTTPTVSLDASGTNLTIGQSTTLTWTSWSSATCTASSNGAGGLWSGGKAVSGSAAIAETTHGLITYSLSCVSGAVTVQDTVQVFFDEAPKKKGGGGAFEWISLLSLLGCAGLRVATTRRARVARPGQ